MKTRRLLYILISILCIYSSYVHAGDTEKLKNCLNMIVKDKDADIGIAVIINGRDTVTVNNDMQYPLMSVFKLHQAVAVANKLSDSNISLDTLIFVRKSEIKKNTYSPMRDRYTDSENFISVRELLRYTLLLSDNNACDILFNHVIDAEHTDSYLRTLGIGSFSISATEEDMQKDTGLCYANWSSPLSAVMLLERLLKDDILKGEYKSFIIDTMTECQTGNNRLPAFHHSGEVKIGHKTGTGGRNNKGETIAVNDIGFVLLPDGQYYTVAVFVKDSKEDIGCDEKIIADVSTIVYNHVANKQQGPK